MIYILLALEQTDEPSPLLRRINNKELKRERTSSEDRLNRLDEDTQQVKALAA